MKTLPRSSKKAQLFLFFLTNKLIGEDLRINAGAMSPDRQLEKTRENPLTPVSTSRAWPVTARRLAIFPVTRPASIPWNREGAEHCY